MHDQPVRVLLLEKEEEDYILTRALFESIQGNAYVVEWVGTADSALLRLEARDHDVYLVDYHLAGGADLTVLRKSETMRLTAPIIVLTAQSNSNIDLTAMRAGAADLLVKGEITPRLLERSVRYAIERKRAEVEIEKLAAFPRRNPNPVLEFAADGTLTYSNGAAEALAYSISETSLKSLLPPQVAEIVAESIRTGATCHHQTARGKRTFVWTFVPVPESKVVHGYASEITERLNLEAQLRHSVKMEAVGQLAAGVAHDFNNILTVIQGHANLLLDSLQEDPVQGKPLKNICLSAEKAGTLIRQLLLFSRKQVMQPRHLDLNDVLQNITRMLQRMMGEDIAVECIENAELPSVHVDSSMIEQVLMNLAVNSREAMPRGGKLALTTSVRTLSESEAAHYPEACAGEFVCLTVRDTGCGMDSSVLPRIFEPFFTTKEIGKGTGLGLAAVYGIVKQHQGWIEVDSGPGAGTTFNLFFPVSGKTAPAAAEPVNEDKVNGGNETILVVEDESALRELVEEILSLYGYDVISACSGVDALRVWEKHREKIDLLLTDMVMPDGISGRELAERLQQQSSELKVIYTSGYSPGMAGKDLALLEGFNFLPKPYPPTRLAELVRECLDGSLETAPAA